MVAADTHNDMTTFKRSAKAGRPGAYGKTLHVEMQGNGFSLYKMKGNIGILWKPLPSVAIEGCIRYFGKHAVNNMISHFL
jgi:hypothetical protein